MTQDEIIDMARQAGLSNPLWIENDCAIIEAFAKLVAAKEREQCALICIEHGESFGKKMLLGFQETLGDAAKLIRARGEA